MTIDYEKRKQEIRREWAQHARPDDPYEWAVERIAELEQTFEMRYQAEQRAIERWQQETGKELTLPDTEDFTMWLLRKAFLEK